MKKRSDKISTIVTVVFVASTIVLTWLGVSINTTYNDHNESNTRHAQAKELQRLIQYYDEVLTMSARLSAATGDPEWERRYRKYEPVLDSAITMATELWPDVVSLRMIAQTDSANQSLVAMEESAFRLVRQGEADSALAILSSSEYDRQKTLYSRGLSAFDSAMSAAASQQAAVTDEAFKIKTIAVLTLIPLLVVAWLAVLGSLARRARDLSAKNTLLARQADELRHLNYDLDRIVVERTSDLERSQELATQARELTEDINKKLLAEIKVREQAEEAVRASEHRLQGILDHAPMVVCLKDPEHRYLYINHRAEQLINVSNSEVVGKTDYDLFPEGMADTYRETDLSVLDNDSVLACEEIAPYDGGIRYYMSVKFPLHDSEGRVYATCCMSNDITERKMMEVALRESREVLQAVLDSIPVRVFWKDRDLRYLGCNTPFAQDAGFEEPGDLIGKDDYDMGWKEQAELYRSDDRAVIESGLGKLNIVEPQTTPSGDQIHLLTSKVPLRSGSGAVTGVLGTYHDVTEHKQAGEKLERMAAFARMNPAPVLRADYEGIINLTNPASTKLFSGDVIGKTISSVLPGWDKATSEWRETDVATEFEHNLGDEIYHFNVRRDASAESVYIYGTNVTLARRLQAQESRAARLEMAGTIAGQVAHDFNNLLAPIVAWPDLIREKLGKDHPAQDLLTEISRAALKIADINQDLLTLGRRGHYNQGQLDLNSVVSDVVKAMSARSSAIQHETDLCENLMPIKGGSAQLHRLLSNLMTNAHDAMEGHGKLSVKTDHYSTDQTQIAFGRIPRGDYVKVTISDTGGGIPSEIIQKILDPFFSTKPADTKRGSGLGLSVVDAVLKDHGGYLDLDSEVGQGTSFYLYFPVSRESISASDDCMTVGGSASILVVDDDQVLCDVTSGLLSKYGYQVKSVTSGEAAIEYLRNNTCDLMIVDMIMPPGMDGAETVRHVLEEHPDQKVIIMSGFSDTERVRAAQRLGAKTVVPKPFTGETIATAVRRELAQAAAETVGQGKSLQARLI